MAPPALGQKRGLHAHGFRTAGQDRCQVITNDRTEFSAHRFGLGGITAAAFFHHAFQHAAHIRHAGGLHGLQINRGKQEGQARVARIPGRIGEQHCQIKRNRLAAPGDGANRVILFQKARSGAEGGRQIISRAAREADHAGPFGQHDPGAEMPLGEIHRQMAG